MFDKILIANRGEIAARVARTCNRLDITTVAIYSDADEGAPHTELADEAHRVGPEHVLKSYLDMDAVLEVADETDCDAIHPGYGLLSENPDFVERVEQEGYAFIGPRSEVMRLMGDKADARAFAEKSGCPIVPGTDGPVPNEDEAVEFAEDVGYPVLVKAAAGGGGIGMQKAEDEESLRSAFQQCQRRGESSFGDDSVYLEKYIENPHHLEIQVLADHHGKALHIFERECSVQRRHQKVIEEAPSPMSSEFPDLRAEMAEAALKIVREADYTNAGTIEFVADPQTGDFYFIEMNTRLQVEHTVSEMITGLDLVEQQIRIADDEPLEFRQEDLSIDGHAIQCRIYAEDADNNFRPAPGTIGAYEEPSGDGIRVDSGARENFEITRYYDPLVAKLVTHGKDRSHAIERMKQALNNYTIEDLTTNIPMHLDVLADQTFIDGDAHTAWLEQR
jgi:acetyl-CoA carboxylase biotin carboxylase subunit